MKRWVLVLLFAAICLGCTDDSDTRSTLSRMGFTHIKTTGWEPFSCGDDYNFSTGFEAINPRGARVRGVVCCGVIKRCSVKF